MLAAFACNTLAVATAPKVQVMAFEGKGSHSNITFVRRAAEL